jgi:hypothetical protein
MPSFLHHATTTRPPSRGYDAPASPRTLLDGAIAGEIHPSVPPDAESRATGDAHAVGDDYWAAGIDLVILRAADQLRRTGIVLPDAQLRRVAEEVVLDTAHFVLDWVEGRGTAVSPPGVDARGAP